MAITLCSTGVKNMHQENIPRTITPPAAACTIYKRQDGFMMFMPNSGYTICLQFCNLQSFSPVLVIMCSLEPHFLVLICSYTGVEFLYMVSCCRPSTQTLDVFVTNREREVKGKDPDEQRSWRWSYLMKGAGRVKNKVQAKVIHGKTRQERRLGAKQERGLGADWHRGQKRKGEEWDPHRWAEGSTDKAWNYSPDAYSWGHNSGDRKPGRSGEGWWGLGRRVRCLGAGRVQGEATKLNRGCTRSDRSGGGCQNGRAIIRMVTANSGFCDQK